MNKQETIQELHERDMIVPIVLGTDTVDEERLQMYRLIFDLADRIEAIAVQLKVDN